MQKNSLVVIFAVNLGLLLTGSIMALSGFMIQFSYHMGHHGSIDKNSVVLGMNYIGWSSIHKISIVIISFLAIAHITLHWKWYKTVLRKKLFAKNEVAIILTILFIIVAITGYIPWFIGLAGGQEAVCKGFVEVHDKLTFVLIVYLVIHVLKKLKWFIASAKKIRHV